MRSTRYLIAVTQLAFAFAPAYGAQEQLPPNLSREPNCVPGTHCMKPGDLYIPPTVPEGFSREPSCVKRTICVSTHLYMIEADFLAIRDLVAAEITTDTWELTSIKDVMHGIVVVSAATKDRGWSWGAGAQFLLEKKADGWAIIRKQRWVV